MDNKGRISKQNLFNLQAVLFLCMLGSGLDGTFGWVTYSLAGAGAMVGIYLGFRVLYDS